MKDAAIAVFLKDLSNMLVSGIGLDHALRTLSETMMDEKIRAMCTQALSELEFGRSLGDALGATGVLPPEALMAVNAGEKAGELPSVFLMLSEYFELKSKIDKQVYSAFGYPIVVIVILLFVMVYMSVNVMPKVSALLPAGAMSSPATVALLVLSAFLKEYWLVSGIVLGVLLAGGIMLMRSDPDLCRLMISRFPLLGKIIKEQELSLGFFALFIFQKSGVPLDTAIREAAIVSGGITGQHLRACGAYLAGGLALSEAVRRDPYFPRFTADTLRIGEESGRFEEYFERLYRMFYRSFQSRMEYLSEAIRPALLVVSAGFIALIAVGFFQPLYGNLTSIASH